MKKGFEIKVNIGYDRNFFFGDGEKLNIVSNIDALGSYPVRIELRKTVEGDDEGNLDGDLIATIYGYYFDINFMENENISLFEIFDSIDQSVYELYEKLFDGEEYKEEFEVFNPNLFYLSDIIVEKEYRRCGYARMFINSLDEILQYVAKLNVGVIATDIYDFETIDNVDSIESLTDEERAELKNNLKKLFVDNDYVFAEGNDDYLIKVLY